MNRAMSIALAAGFIVVSLAGSASAQDKAAAGQAAFAAGKCQMCHSIADKGNKKGELDDVGSKLKPEEIRAWITDPVGMREKAKATRTPAMPKNSLSKDQVDALVAYLSTLKK